MKPDWDKLADKFKDSESVVIADVDCTDEAAKDVCTKQGVKGYPTIKYWLAGNPSGKDYKGGRDFSTLKLFTENTFKPGCELEKLDQCTEDERTFLNSMSSKNAEEEKTTREKLLEETVGKRKAAASKFDGEKKEFQKQEKLLQKQIGLAKKVAALKKE